MAANALDESALRVSDCVTELLRKQPFFGSLVLKLPLRSDPTRWTLATRTRGPDCGHAANSFSPGKSCLGLDSVPSSTR